MKDKYRIVIYEGKKKFGSIICNNLHVSEERGVRYSYNMGKCIGIVSNGQMRGSIKFWSGMRDYEDFRNR